MITHRDHTRGEERASDDGRAGRVGRQSVLRTMVRATKRKATAPKATSRTTAGTYSINKDDDDDANDDDDDDMTTRTTMGELREQCASFIHSCIHSSDGSLDENEDADRRASETTERLTR